MFVLPHLLSLPDSAVNWSCMEVKGGHSSCYRPYVLQPFMVYTDPMQCTTILIFFYIPHLRSASSLVEAGVASLPHLQQERSPAQSKTFVECSVLFVGVLRGGPENVTP